MDINFYVVPFNNRKTVGFCFLNHATAYAKCMCDADIYHSKQVAAIRNNHVYLNANWTTPMMMVRNHRVAQQ